MLFVLAALLSLLIIWLYLGLETEIHLKLALDIDHYGWAMLQTFIMVESRTLEVVPRNVGKTLPRLPG